MSLAANAEPTGDLLQVDKLQEKPLILQGGCPSFDTDSRRPSGDIQGSGLFMLVSKLHAPP